jgi:hypothetical protein
MRLVMIPKRGEEVSRVVQAVFKDRGKLPLHVFSQLREEVMLKDYSSKLSKDFNAQIVIETAEKSSAQKAGMASPSKPAIILE